ncbi:hypothetical protein GJAV_G00023560 [Gymnothorax javanicus]|nr:hypothetical protein GJAV_G00023560 [Gymnothorax javanicus]
MSMAETESCASIVPKEKDPLRAGGEERLHVKHGKGTTNRPCVPGGLDARSWRFLKPGLDDFRSGYPAAVGDEYFIREGRGLSPADGGERGARKLLTKEQACFSRASPQQHARRKHVAEVEYTLSRHPLALYPHYQECMSPELLDQVMSVLDPEMGAHSEAASVLVLEHEDDWAQQDRQRMEDVSSCNGDINTPPDTSVRADSATVMNPYLHLRVTAKDDQAAGEHSGSPTLDEEIKRVTQQLHDWVVTLDGERDDLTESSMLTLLTAAFEMRPPVGTPKRRHGGQQQGPSADVLNTAAHPNTFQKLPDSLKIDSGKADCGPWSSHLKREESRDWGRSEDLPAASEDRGSAEAPAALDDGLEESYAVQAFRKFIASKGQREPEWLQSQKIARK